MAFTLEQRRLLWLSAAEIAPDRLSGLLAEFGSLEGIWEGFSEGRVRGLRPKTEETLRGLHSDAAMDDLIGRMEKSNVRVLFREDPAYPYLLSFIDDPPYVLYSAGDTAAFQRPMVAVVGTRLPSAYGRDMAVAISSGLAEAGFCVVSGLARGIDSAAHEGVLKAGGVTVAVLGSGINVPYPPENVSMMRHIARSGGLVVSEYPLDAEPATYHFPHRNRVISGLSHALVFVEGKVKSGGMLTVASALRQGREVFAVPGRIGNSGAEGPHSIIREGARLITCAQDVMDDLGVDLRRFLPRGRGPEEEEAAPTGNPVLDALSREPMTLDGLAKETGRSPQDLMTELSVMEVLGQVRRETGNLFVLSIE